jgi:BR serine/threonine kinase
VKRTSQITADSACEVPDTFGGFVRGRELGRGAFAVVYACERKSDTAKFAAKAVDLRQLRLFVNVAREVKKLRREASVLQQLPPHPNLVKFVDVIQEGHWLFFLLELVDRGNLLQAIVRRPPGRAGRLKFRESEARHVFGQLVDGLKVLHSKGIVHRDLKLENVLVVREQSVGPDLLLDVKIADFGLSKVVGEGASEARSTVGSPRYMAPEVIAKGTHDFRADLWSLGVLAHVLLDGRFPCDGASAKVPQDKLNEAIGKLPVSKDAQGVVLGLLQLEPSSRLTISQLCKHPWLTSGGRANTDKRLVIEGEGTPAIASRAAGAREGRPRGGGSVDKGAKRLRVASADPDRGGFFGREDEAAVDDAILNFKGAGKKMLNFSPGK